MARLEPMQQPSTTLVVKPALPPLPKLPADFGYVGRMTSYCTEVLPRR